MAEGILTITGRAKFEQLHKEMQKQMTQMDKLRTKIKQLEDQSKKADSSQENSAKNLTRHLSRLALQYLSIQKAAELYNSSLENQIRLERAAFRDTSSLADAQRLLLTNLGPKVTKQQFDLARFIVQNLSQIPQIGISEQVLAQEFGQALSATEGAPDLPRQRRVAKAIAAAAPFFRGKRERELGEFVGPALTVSKAVPEITPAQSVRLLLGVQGQARIIDVANLKNLVSPIASESVNFPQVTNKVQQVLETFAFEAALGSRAEDPSGEKTGTATNLLTEVLRETISELPKGPRRERLESLPLIQRILEINKDRALAEKVFEAVRGRAATRGGVKEAFIATGILRSVILENALKVLPELVVTEKEVQNFTNLVERGSPELAIANQAKSLAVRRGAERRREFGAQGAVFASIFGGQVGDEELPSIFDTLDSPDPVTRFIDKSISRVKFNALRLVVGEFRAAKQVLRDTLVRQLPPDLRLRSGSRDVGNLLLEGGLGAQFARREFPELSQEIEADPSFQQIRKTFGFVQEAERTQARQDQTQDAVKDLQDAAKDLKEAAKATQQAAPPDQIDAAINAAAAAAQLNSGKE